MNQSTDRAHIIFVVLSIVLVLAVTYLASRFNELLWVVTTLGLIIAIGQWLLPTFKLRTAHLQGIKNFLAQRGFAIFLIILAVLMVLNLATALVVYNPLGIFSGPAPKWTFQANGPITSSPAVVNGVVYVGSDDGYLYALNADSGARKWAFQTNGPIHSSPSVPDNGMVYVGSDDGYLYALNEDSGTRKWAFQTNGPIHSSPSVVNGMVYVGSEDHSLYALDAAKGTRKWAFQTDGPIDSSPQAPNGMLYIGSNDGKLYAFGPLS